MAGEKKGFIIKPDGTLMDYRGREVNIELPENVKDIDPWFFFEHPEIESIDPGENKAFFTIGGALYHREEEERCLMWTPKNLEPDFRIPMNVTIVLGTAFSGRAQLRSLYIPSSVKYFDEETLKGCSSLARIIVDSDNPFYQSKDGLLISLFDPDNCENRLPIVLCCPPMYEGNLIIPTGTVRVCSLENCNRISTISIPESVEDFLGTFPLSPLFTTIRVETSHRFPFFSVDGVLYETEDLYYSEKTVLYCMPAGRRGEFEIPDGVVAIGAFAFRGSRLSRIFIPPTVEEIGIGAFEKCYDLKTLTIPESVKRIDTGAFDDCLFDLHIKASKDIIDDPILLEGFHGKIFWDD